MSFCSTRVAQTVSRYIYNSEWLLLSEIMNTLIVLMFSTHTQIDSLLANTCNTLNTAIQNAGDTMKMLFLLTEVNQICCLLTIRIKYVV